MSLVSLSLLLIIAIDCFMSCLSSGYCQSSNIIFTSASVCCF
nr:MAG TPA: hypothetical protein [Caudoviricetes sp.]